MLRSSLDDCSCPDNMVPLREGSANCKKRSLREEYNYHELELDPAKKLRDDITCLLDDTEADDLTKQGLDLVVKTFEQEIYAPPFEPTVPVIDLASTNVEKHWLELGYLIEATDDELGLPPPNATFRIEAVNAGSCQDDVLGSEIGTELVRLGSKGPGTPVEHIPCFDAYDVGMDEGLESILGDCEFSETLSAGLDFSDLLWWPDSLPATQ